MPDQKMTFKEGYRILKENAEKLRNDAEPDIDVLEAIMDKSTQAYQACMDRINAVKKSLEKYADQPDEAAPRVPEEGISNVLTGEVSDRDRDRPF